jgi:predicted NBD/HSP70 family sugar kinase
VHDSTFPRSWLSPGWLFDLFLRSPEKGLSKRELVALTGLSRTAVSQRIDVLVDAGFLRPSGPPGTSERGRPAERYTVDLGQGVILVADTGATGMRTALTDPTGTILVESYERLDITTGPEPVLGLIHRRFTDLLAQQLLTPAEVLGIGISVPGPVAADLGRVITPPIMTGWHDYDIPAYFAADFSCPVVVENDVNAMVVGEHRLVHDDVDDMVFVKLGTGIGTGLYVGGQLCRGADGTAGDIGHIPRGQPGPDTPRCRCGSHGCLEAIAGGWAILRDLRAAGLDVDTLDDVVDAVRSGDESALETVRAAATAVGEALADLVHLLNPRVLVVGGQLAALDEIILAAAREVVYRRSPPLSTRKLVITTSGISDPGVRGLSALVGDHIFAPDRVEQIVATRSAHASTGA